MEFTLHACPECSGPQFPNTAFTGTTVHTTSRGSSRDSGNPAARLNMEHNRRFFSFLAFSRTARTAQASSRVNSKANNTSKTGLLAYAGLTCVTAQAGVKSASGGPRGAARVACPVATSDATGRWLTDNATKNLLRLRNDVCIAIIADARDKGSGDSAAVIHRKGYDRKIGIQARGGGA